MSEALNKYKAAKEIVANARKEADKVVKTAFNEVLKELFVENPKLISFSWTQYTPYFNDGDECTFSANIDYPSVVFIAADGKVVKRDSNTCDAEVGETADDLSEVAYDGPEYKLYEPEFEKFEKIVAKFLGIFEEEDLRTLFDDHVEVTATAKGATTEEYSHD